jgi:hypothetical protein
MAHESETMTTAASVGDATGVLEKHVTTPDPLSFAGQVAVHEQPTTVLDTFTTELQVDEMLKRNGIHSLLGLRLPPHDPVFGVLYIGRSDVRRFSARELQRIEWLPALPPKIPYSCCTQVISTSLTFKKSAARRYAGWSASAISKRTDSGYAYDCPPSFIATTKQSAGGNSPEIASLRSVVNVAIPHCLGT